jgi:hypothetical protein
MTAKRAAAYCGGGLLLLAGFSFAGALARQTSGVPETAVPVQTTGTANLAAEVQAQTSRLRARLAQAPARTEPLRNPFTFAPREPLRRPNRAVAEPAPLPEVALPPAEPAIELVGVAEDNTERGVVRTAIVSSLAGDLFLVKEGDKLAGRYSVKAVGADAVELIDTLTNATKRLALRH